MIDDALFLKVAAQILRDPLRPFSVNVNWYGWDEPLWAVFKNPPGLSYWLAGVTAMVGPIEIAWHLSLLPFAIAAVLAMYRLGQRFTESPGWTTAMLVASPAFLISASTLMADVPALALTSWGLVLWIDGGDGDSRRSRWAGALLSGLAVMVKYTAAVSVLTLPLYTVLCTSRTRRRAEVIDLWPAVIPPLAWALLTLSTTGRIHLIDALLVRGGGFDPNPGWFGHRVIALLTFIAGAGVFPLLSAGSLVKSGVGRVLAIVAGGFGVIAAIVTPTIWSPRGLLPGATSLVGVLAAIGTGAVLMTCSAAFTAARRNDRDGAFLVGSIALHSAFLLLWSWTIAARFVLPMLVPLALLFGRVLPGEQVSGVRPMFLRRLLGGGSVTVRLAGVTLMALVLSIVLLRADRVAGDFHRRVVAGIGAQARREHRPVLFTGAWGFSYYAEQAGMQRLDCQPRGAGDSRCVRAPELPPRALVLRPYFVANNQLPPDIERRLSEIANIPSPAPLLALHTMNLNAGAGFYSSSYGPLPFMRAYLPADGVIVWTLRD